MRTSRNKLYLALAITLISTTAHALPIGFGRTQGKLDYNELKNKNFHVYFDKRTPLEGELTLRALENAKPRLESWLGVSRSRPLPVVMSATTWNASFANFITDSIELQTMGQASRDLAWHEYVHSTMYRHLDNWLGPAGSIIHLPWMPAWWLEGLAEAFSVSVGSDVQGGVERYQALSGDWPTYERLHSLYAKYNFVLRGYATSGAFVAYILRKKPELSLPQLHNDFYHASMPWMIPWAILPFAPSMPMDVALNKAFTANGRELYEQYKKDATAYWEKNTLGEMLLKRPGVRADFNGIYSLQTRGDTLTQVYSENNSNYEATVTFGDKSIFAVGTKQPRRLPDELATSARLITPKWSLFVRSNKEWQGEYGSHLTVQTPTRTFNWTTRNAHVENLFETANTIAWLEREPELVRLCFASKTSLEQRKVLKSSTIQCPFTAKLHNVEVIGSDQNWQASKRKVITDRIVLRYTQQTHIGDKHQVITWHGGEDLPVPMNISHGGQPVAYARTAGSQWLLVSEQNRRVIRRIDDAGQCLSVLGIDDTPISMHAMANGNLILPLMAGSRQHILRLNPESIKQLPCRATNGHYSPLLAANRADKALTMHEAVMAASNWQDEKVLNPAAPIVYGKTPTLDNLPLAEDAVPEIRNQPASWRGRMVGAMPWIGADASGYNIGTLSVPLMDEMQNETVRLTALYGLYSRYPSTELSFTSTRFWPVLSFDVFRYQSWDGTFGGNTFYYDEKGGRLSASLYLTPLSTSVTVGMKGSMLKRYIGPADQPQGYINEPFVAINYGTTLGSFNWALGTNARGTPSIMNQRFAYDVLGFATSLSRRFSLLDSVATISLEGSRTRGPRRRYLQETYRPLRVFVPGDGGGLNNVNVPISGSGWLFHPLNGENQARSAASLTFPLVNDLDTLIRLFYLERLDFTAFYNYGGAWRGPTPPADRLISAHGYNLDLLVDVKGFKFNAGGGVGQVVGEDFDTYLSFGFDAFF